MSVEKGLSLRWRTPTPMVLHARVVSNQGGGPDKTIFRSARYAAKVGLRMAAMVIHPRRSTGIATLRTQAQQWNMPLFEVPESGALDVGTIRAATQLCRKHRVTIWHGHDYKTDVLGLIVRRFWPMKLVTTVHGFTRESLRTRFYAHLDNMALRAYDHVIAVSPQLVQHCYQQGVSPERLTYIPNAIELDEYQRTMSRADRRAELGIEQDRLVLGVVGRLSIEKGVDRALRMLAYLKHGYPTLQLHIVGDGPQRSTLEKLAQSLGVRAMVRFWGWQEQIQPYLEAMDVLLLPSRREGMPNVVLEAMALGVPVAATNVGGVRDLLAWGACGIVLDDDESAWPSQLASLLTSPEKRNELARHARLRVEQHYTFERRMARVFAVYNKVLRIASDARPTWQVPTRKAA